MREYVLIWSNEHGMWSRAARRGYTPFIQWAGVYEYAEAAQLAARAGMSGSMTATDNLGLYADVQVPKRVLVPVPWPAGEDTPYKTRRT